MDPPGLGGPWGSTFLVVCLPMSEHASSFETPSYAAARKQPVLRIVPVNHESKEARDRDAASLIRYLERTGECPTVKPYLMMRARSLYIRKLMDKRDVARAVKVEVGMLDRWIAQFGWEDLRREEEFRLFRKVAGVRKRILGEENIDEKHDLMFHSLEALIEDTVFRIKRGELECSVRDLTSLASAARTCMDSRRTIHRKEGSPTRHIHELQDGSLLDEFAAMLTDTVAPRKLTVEIGESVEVRPAVYEDVEHEGESG